MIVRIWHGRTRRGRADEYAAFSPYAQFRTIAALPEISTWPSCAATRPT